MNNQILENCPKCNNKWNHIIDEGSQKICICSKCNYTKFYDLSSQNETDIKYILKELQKSNIPKVITASYDNLITLLEHNEIYGALIKIKDIFELTIKLPLVILLSHISNKVYQKDNSNSDFVNKFSSLHAMLQELIHDALSYQLTLGNWVSIAGEIKQKKVTDLFTDTDPTIILETLYRINQINHKAFTSNKHGEPVTAWRNKTIGHGALNCNKEEVKKDILQKLDLLNTLLKDTMDEYAKINIAIVNDLITVSSTNNNTNIVVEPFITITKEKSNEDANQNIEDFQLNNLSIFDSYNDKKQIGHVINHANGKKDTSDDLSEALSFINDNFKKSKALEVLNADGLGNLTDDTIYTDTIELLNTLQSSTFYQGSYFSDWFINCIDNYSGGVFLCCAERGMGKSAFTRAIDQNENVNIKDNATLKTYLSEHKDILIRTFHFNSYYNSDVFTFIARLKDIFTSELIIEENKTSYIKSITYIAHSIEENYVSLFNSLNNDTIALSERKSLFLEFLKSLHSVWKYKYYKEKLILVLDGIDEIKSGTNNINIADWIPTPEEIKTHKLENIYFILTSRCMDEVASNHELYSFLDSKIFTDTLVLKRESEGSKYESPYSNTFIADIQNSLVTKVNGETKKYTRKEAIQLGKVLEWRFNYLTAYKKIYQLCAEEELQNFITDPFGTYINHLDKLSKSYSQDIQLLLNLLAMTNEALTINEISYLLTGDNRPTFRTYGMLIDIANFLTIERDSRRGTLFNLSHPDWLEKLEKNPTILKNKDLLIKNLTYLLNTLITKELPTKDFSIWDYDGETWLISNIEKTSFNVAENILLTVPLLGIDFGDHQYQTLRSVRLYEYLLTYFKTFNINKINPFMLPSYIHICNELLRHYSHINDNINGKLIYDLLTNMCNEISENSLTKNFPLLEQLATAYNSLANYTSLTNTKEASYLYRKAITIYELLAEEFKKGSYFFDLTVLSAAYHDLAYSLEKIDPKEAKALYIKSIYINEQLAHKLKNDNNLQQYIAFSCNCIAKLLESSNPQESIKYFRKSLSILENLAENFINGGRFFDLNHLATAYNNLACALAKTNPNEAIALHRKSIEISEQLLNEFNNCGKFFDITHLATSYSNLASLLKYDYPNDAIKLHQKSVNICEQLAEDYKNGGRFFDLNNLAASYNNLAYFIEPTKPEDAKALYRKVITIHEQLAEDYKNGGRFFDLNHLANTYNNLANVLYPTNSIEASKFRRKTITIFEQLAEDYKNGGRFFDLDHLANAYHNLANILYPTNSIEASKLLHKAITIYEQLAEDYKNGGRYFNLDHLATAYNNLAYSLEKIDPKEAKALYIKSIYIREQLFAEYKNTNLPFDPKSLADSYLALAIFSRSTEHEQAIQLLKKAINIYENLALICTANGKYFDFNSLGISYFNLAILLEKVNHEETITFYKKAIDICEQMRNDIVNKGKSFDPANLANCYYKLATYIGKSNPEETVKLLHKDIAICEQLAKDFTNGGKFFDMNHLATSYNNLAWILQSTNSIEAVKLYRKAIIIYEQLAEDSKNGGRFFNLTSLANCYNNLAKLLENSNYKEAITIYYKTIAILEPISNNCDHNKKLLHMKHLIFAYDNLITLLENNTTESTTILEIINKSIFLKEQLANEYKNNCESYDTNNLINSYKKRDNLLQSMNNTISTEQISPLMKIINKITNFVSFKH